MSMSMSMPVVATMDGSDDHQYDGSGDDAPVLSSEPTTVGVPKRRSSQIVLEGVEYDLSNLLVDSSHNSNSKNKDGDDDCSTSSYEDDDSEDDSTSGFVTCRSKGTRGTARSRGTMSRNISNASTIFELPDKSLFESNENEPLRRDSPYRFDMSAMRTLMTSFRGVPELQNSFRLSKSGAINLLDDEADEPSNSTHNNNLLSQGDNDNSEEDEEADLFLQVDSKNFNNDKPEPADTAAAELNTSGETVKTTASTYNTEFDSASRQEEEEEKEEIQPEAAPPTTQQLEHQYEEEEEGIDDLIYDEATGTYVYRDYEYTYPDQPEPQPVDYHEPCETNTEHDRRFTLEAMTADAAMGAEDDPEGGAYDDEECEMEISPGIYVPFRGAKETWQAVATQTTHELECFDCGLVLVCINDCEFTVCPDCRVVNPVFCEDPIGKPFGVGMGFNKQWVLKKQLLQHQKQG